ncbi:hypothetical protein N9933_00715 [bacterium]|nr:hypothetical protein [bacterium]
MQSLNETLFQLDLTFKNLHPQKKRLFTFFLVLSLLVSIISWEYYQTHQYQQELAALRAENAEFSNKLYGIARFGVQLDEYISSYPGQADSAENLSPVMVADTLYGE